MIKYSIKVVCFSSDNKILYAKFSVISGTLAEQCELLISIGDYETYIFS